jgi:hypothetical protein
MTSPLRTSVSTALAALFGAALVSGGLVLSAGTGVAHAETPNRSIRIVGDTRLQINQMLQFGFRFADPRAHARTGSTLTWLNQVTPPDIHTITLVDEKDLPKTLDDVFNCPVCATVAAAQFPQDAPPLPVMNTGREGLDAPGDSLFVPAGGSVTATVSAPPGTVLHYLCIVHPWMQASIEVRDR